MQQVTVEVCPCHDVPWALSLGRRRCRVRHNEAARRYRERTPEKKRDRAEYNRAYQLKHKERIAQQKREKHAEAIKRLREIKRTAGCRDCGFDNPVALHFHHRNPAEKSFSISHSGWRVSEKRLMAEIAKCDVICANCHFILHAQPESRTPKGTA